MPLIQTPVPDKRLIWTDVMNDLKFAKRYDDICVEGWINWYNYEKAYNMETHTC